MEFEQRGLMTKIFSVIGQTPLFAGLTEEETQMVLQELAPNNKAYPKDDFILRAGENISSMGIILSGKALVIQEDLWGNRNVITRLSAGDLFAEPFALLGGVPLSISVVAKEPCQVMWVSVQMFFGQKIADGDIHSKVMQNLMTILAGKLLLFNDKVTHMSKRKTRDKLLSYLSAESFRQNSLDFSIPFDRQQLADYLGVERAAMSTELSKLQREGLIETDRSHFILKK